MLSRIKITIGSDKELGRKPTGLPAVRSGSRTKFDDFLAGVDNPAKPVLQNLRKRILDELADIVEDVRMHRIVYGKDDVMRSFLDIQVFGTMIKASIYTGKSFKDPDGLTDGQGNTWRYVMISPDDDCEKIFKLISQAHHSV